MIAAVAGDLGQPIPVGPDGIPVIGRRTVVFEQVKPRLRYPGAHSTT